jgi:hypothetical protein
MLKVFLTFLFINTFFYTALAQAVFRMYESPSLHEWQSGRHIVKKKDRYYICGEMSHFQPIVGGREDGIIMCVDSSGGIIWQNSYGSDRVELLNKIVPSYNDNTLTAYGYTYAFFKTRRAWLLNIDTSGNVNWQAAIIDSVNHLSLIENIESFKGGYIISGSIGAYKEVNKGCFISLLGDDGSTKWSRLYIFDSLQPNRANYAIYHADDSLGYGFGIARDKIIYFQVNLLNGDVVKVNSYKLKKGISPLLLYGALYDDENSFYVFSGGTISDSSDYLILFKISSDGMVTWSKAYSYRDYSVDLFIVPRPTMTKDKGIIFGNRFSTISLLDSLGDVVFSNTYAHTSSLLPVRHVIQDDNGEYIAVGDIISNISPGRDIVFFKVDAKGETLGCCTVEREMDIVFRDIVNLNTDPINYTQTDYYPFEKINISTPFNRKLNEVDACFNASPIRRDTVRICEGDSINIGGVYYNTPQTITSTLKDNNKECDTLLFTTVEYWRPSDGDVYNMSFVCPQDIEIYLDDDAQKAKVYYEYPEVFSECYCNNNEIKLLEGRNSGEEFPLGVTKNCYEVKDVCGNHSSCCFTVSVRSKNQQKYCDEKKIDCLSFHLLSVKIDSFGNSLFKCKVSNECNSPIRYVYFEMPKGIVARYPSHLSFYLSQSGREYQVRNPHHSHFYSISFQPSGQLFLSGYSDVFEYALPPQAHVQYFKAAARLASGKYYEVHLNTFKCSEDYTEQPPIYYIRDRKQIEGIYAIPNPVRKGGTLYFNIEKNIECTVFIQDISGRILYEKRLSDNSTSIGNIDLPAGMYMYTIIFGDSRTARGKFLVTD